jgi:hypothetical protein
MLAKLRLFLEAGADEHPNVRIPDEADLPFGLKNGSSELESLRLHLLVLPLRTVDQFVKAKLA